MGQAEEEGVSTMEPTKLTKEEFKVEMGRWSFCIRRFEQQNMD
jgi:hypothetical protein